MAFAHTAEGSDVEALKQGFATVTPLDYVLTHSERMQLWRERVQSSINET